MAHEKSIIKPQFLYDEDRKPVMVYCSISDFNRLTKRLEDFSQAARKKSTKSK